MVTWHAAQHRASILVKIMVSECDPKTREATAKLVQKDVLKQHGITPKQVITIEGFSCENCLEKLRKWLESAGR